jgi:hypothetical protein
MVNPASLFALAISSTLMDLPTAFPYVGAIGILLENGVHLPIAIVVILVYCLIYVFPMIIIYIIFSLIQGERLNKIANGFKNIINNSAKFLPILLFIIAILLIRDGLARMP